jgi:hypothetical protein
MLSSISPLGERARGQRYPVTVGAYLLASTAGGALVGGVLGTVGAPLGLPFRPVAVLLAVAAALTALADGSGRRPPRPRRQVDERWLHAYRGWVYGAGYGAQLGVGAATVISTAALPLLWLAEVLSGSPVTGVLLGAAFGAARALPLLLGARATRPAALRATHARLAAAAPAVRAGTVGVCLLLAAGLAGVAVAG